MTAVSSSAHKSSSSRMRVIYHNWSSTKQRPHPQSVAEISRHSAVHQRPHWTCYSSSVSCLNRPHRSCTVVVYLLQFVGIGYLDTFNLFIIDSASVVVESRHKVSAPGLVMAL